MRALIVFVLSAFVLGCATPPLKPEPVFVTVRVPVAVPSELTADLDLPPLEDGSVRAYLKQRLLLLDIVSTYAYRMKLIRELPDDR